MTIGERIRLIRKSLPDRTTQKAFGQPLGVSEAVITSYELNKAVPPEPTFRLICTVYNVNPLWLRTGEGEMNDPIDEDDVINRVMSGDNDLAKSVMRAFARRAEENPTMLDDLRKIIDEVHEAMQKGEL